MLKDPPSRLDHESFDSDMELVKKVNKEQTNPLYLYEENELYECCHCLGMGLKLFPGEIVIKIQCTNLFWLIKVSLPQMALHT